MTDGCEASKSNCVPPPISPKIGLSRAKGSSQTAVSLSPAETLILSFILFIYLTSCLLISNRHIKR